ncbi:reticulocyte-binding protein 2 [Ophiostoma piceae UAMH 11346]|uniref:Reticulocyte-binding protein 2 n=1 Tax=Ophiostoma piceae (strain UAMH 11346) TaxID=1262450 RepID=S3BSS5_OPHP1|nr:reticulocyte-binding protein 2 [Ophiostoma piceae UAMH 11346]
MPENPLAALGPIAWESLDCNDLDGFLAETFACAQIIADSVPATAAPAAAAATTGRPRSQTDGAVSYNPSKIWGWGGAATPTPPATSTDDGLPGSRDKKLNELRQSWKEVRTGGVNPRAVTVYKMNGGREGYSGSSWFARRSLHKKSTEKAPAAGLSAAAASASSPATVDLDFETFKRGLLHEFDLAAAERSNDKKKTPVRTMVTKKHIEHHVVKKETSETKGELNIFLLEADFPGPTASRDFVTMLLTAESSVPGITGGCKQFMMVSKPCQHPETPTRSGFVRAQYESVEMIREVPIPKAEAQSLTSPSTMGRRTRSSIDLGRNSLDQEQDEGHQHQHHSDTHDMAIEWIMITRNNPGGNVPRFLVDKSTPSSIISDANKFMDWLVAKVWAEQGVKGTAGEKGKEGKEGSKQADTQQQRDPAPDTATSLGGLGAAIHEEEEEEARGEASARSAKPVISENNDIPSIRGGAASSTRLFNMFAGALGGASTAVVSKLPNPFEGAVDVLCPEFGVAKVKETQSRGDDSSDDDLDDDVSEDTGGDSYSDIEDHSSDKASDKTNEDTSDKSSDNIVQQDPDHEREPTPPTRASTGISLADGPQTTTVPVAAAAAAAATITVATDPSATSSGSSSRNSPEADDADSKSTSSKTRSVDTKTKEEKGQEKKERSAQKLLEKHNKAVARREAQFHKELQKLEQKRRQQADKEAARLQKRIAGKSGADNDKSAGKNKGKDIGGLLEYTQRELEKAAIQIEVLQKEVRQLELENRQLKLGIQGSSIETAKM